MNNERNISNKPKPGRNLETKSSSKYFSFDETKNNRPRIIKKEVETVSGNIPEEQETEKGEAIPPGYTPRNIK
jgi:hypothetical protein